MREQKAFDLGVLAGFLFAVAAFSVNWLITPMSHPSASSLQRAGVIAQALLSLGIALFLVLRRRTPRPSPSAV